MTLGFGETFKSGYDLFDRYQRQPALRAYVKLNGLEIVLAIVVLAIVAVAMSAAAIAFVGGQRKWLVLLALVGGPLLLIAQLSLTLYLFFSWIEGRVSPLPAPQHAATRWLHRSMKVNLGRAPVVPWPMVGVFVGVPFLVMAWLSWPTALVIVLLAIAMPVVYARVDQLPTAAV